MAVLLANQVAGTLATSVSSASTSMVLALATNSTALPSLGGSDWYYLTIIDQGSYAGQVSPPAKREIVKVTAASGNTITMMVRGQDGTTPQDWASGDRVELRLCNAALVDFMSATTLQSGTFTPTGTMISNLSSLTPGPSQYQGSNGIVTVSGFCTMDLSSANSTVTELSLTLPPGILGTVSSTTARGVCCSVDVDSLSKTATGIVYGTGTTVNLKFAVPGTLNTSTCHISYVYTAKIQ